MKKNVLVLLLLIAVFSSCKKDNASLSQSQDPPLTNVLNANAYIVDTLTIATVTDSTITLSQSTFNAQVGNVLLGAPNSQAPFGFLRKIVMVKEVGGKTVCSTVQSSLNEAFKQLYINATGRDTINKISTFGVNAGSGASYRLQFHQNSTIAKGVTYDGEIDCNIPSTSFEYIKQAYTFNPQKASIKADINTNGSFLTMTYTLASNLQLAKEYTLGTYSLPPFSFTVPITTPLGIIPFPIKFTQKVIFTTLPLNFSGKASVTVHPEISATVGALYENGLWSNLSTFSIAGNADALSKSNFDLSATLNANAIVIKPRYEISPFGIEALKGFFEVPASLDLTVQNKSPNFSLKFNLDVTGGIDQKIFTGLDQTYSITGNAINKTILEGDFKTYNLLKVSGDKQTDSVGFTLKQQAKVQVVDSASNVPLPNITVTFTPATGSGVASNTTVVTDANGYAAVSWQLGKQANETLTASIVNFDQTKKIIFTATALLKATQLVGSLTRNGGIITATATGGTRPFQYKFLIPNKSSSILSLDSIYKLVYNGYYSVVIADAKGQVDTVEGKYDDFTINSVVVSDGAFVPSSNAFRIAINYSAPLGLLPNAGDFYFQRSVSGTPNYLFWFYLVSSTLSNTTLGTTLQYGDVLDYPGIGTNFSKTVYIRMYKDRDKSGNPLSGSMSIRLQEESGTIHPDPYTSYSNTVYNLSW